MTIMPISAQPSPAIDPGNLRAAAKTGERFQSYNVEMAEIIGGNFWKPYGAAGTVAAPCFKRCLRSTPPILEFANSRPGLSRGRRSGGAVKHRRIPAGVLPFRNRKKARDLAGRGRPHRGQRQPGASPSRYAWRRKIRDPYDWAVKFEEQARQLMVAGEFEPLVDCEKLGAPARFPPHAGSLPSAVVCDRHATAGEKHQLSDATRKKRPSSLPKTTNKSPSWTSRVRIPSPAP
jgi:hypothetical protein